MANKVLLLLLIIAICSNFVISNAGKDKGDKKKGGLMENFYEDDCPGVEEIVQRVTESHVSTNPNLPAKLLRLHFHDCFVRGCEGSVLLNSVANTKSEKESSGNKNLAGFEVIDDIKAAVEKECPGIVSCADILALATRDAVSLQYGRPLWDVLTGRRDGTISLASEAESNLPSSFSNLPVLKKNFAKKGLSVRDLVVLSGAHTIGVGHCNFFNHRLFNFTGKGDQDPSLDPTYASFLKTQCKGPSDSTTTVELDPKSSLSFDNHFFQILKEHKGLFMSDAALLTDKKAEKIVDELLSPESFLDEFARSMEKMGTIDVLTGGKGQIRKQCSVAN
ncbi:peroxidase 24-like [Chenopodium quinoa]|uniref:Peroxidase n=1 Tax=Chenopodium quinoa TaxID=63459 RepID=A0A803MWT7_CHEQI|nr:peroxidase 24-like [Chenopodium quinoa]